MIDKKHTLGEYIRDKMADFGLKQAEIARKLDISPQRFQTQYITRKNMITPEEYYALKKVLPSEFFDDFLNEHSIYKEYFGLHNVASEPAEVYHKSKNSGFSISIEIDPENFNPDDAEKIGEGLKEMLRKISEKGT